jgi:hypothetical protein
MPGIGFRYNSGETSPHEVAYFLRTLGYGLSHRDFRRKAGGGTLAILVDRYGIAINYPRPHMLGTADWSLFGAATIDLLAADIFLISIEISPALLDRHILYRELARQIPEDKDAGRKLYRKLKRKFQLGKDAWPKGMKHQEVVEYMLVKCNTTEADPGDWWRTNVLRKDFRYNPQAFSPLELINELEGQGYQKVISDERPFHLFIVKFPEIGLYIEFPDADLAEITKKQENLFPFVYWVPDHDLFGNMYTAHSIETGLGEGDPVEIANLEKAFNEHYEEGKRVFEALQKKYQRSEGDVVTELKDWDKVEEFMEGGAKKGWLSKLLG